MKRITVSANVNKSIDVCWDCYTNPTHIIHWNFAHESWHCPKATNTLIVGSSFSYRMEAKDGSHGFDFEGVYDIIEPLNKIGYHMLDQRNVIIEFSSREADTHIDVTFDLEQMNSEELQRMGWEAILNQFKSYVESL